VDKVHCDGQAISVSLIAGPKAGDMTQVTIPPRVP
jgi:hypothetical protein